MHKKLKLDIGDRLPVSSWGLKNFKYLITLGRREKEKNSSSAEDLLEVWEQQGHLSVGNYGELIQLLSDANLKELVGFVKGKEEEIKQQMEVESTTGSTVQPASSPYQSMSKTEVLDALQSECI